MKESVITVNFDVESEAYQALSEIKRHPDGSGCKQYSTRAHGCQNSLIEKKQTWLGLYHAATHISAEIQKSAH